jgi:hypothetical protein
MFLGLLLVVISRAEAFAIAAYAKNLMCVSCHVQRYLPFGKVSFEFYHMLLFSP